MKTDGSGHHLPHTISLHCAMNI